MYFNSGKCNLYKFFLVLFEVFLEVMCFMKFFFVCLIFEFERKIFVLIKLFYVRIGCFNLYLFCFEIIMVVFDFL